jgi:hypothetical protein
MNLGIFTDVLTFPSGDNFFYLVLWVGYWATMFGMISAIISFLKEKYGRKKERV